MRQIANIALIQAIFPIFVHLPKTIELLVATFVDSSVWIPYLSNPIINVLLQIPTYAFILNGMVLPLSIAVALADLRRPIVKIIKKIINKLMCGRGFKISQLTAKVTVVGVKSSLNVNARSRTINHI
jgi:hypothetical protein